MWCECCLWSLLRQDQLHAAEGGFEVVCLGGWTSVPGIAGCPVCLWQWDPRVLYLEACPGPVPYLEVHSLSSRLSPSFMLGPPPVNLCVGPLLGVTADACTPWLVSANCTPRTFLLPYRCRPSALHLRGGRLVASLGRVLSDGAWCCAGICTACAPGRKRGLCAWWGMKPHLPVWHQGQGSEPHASPPAAYVAC